MRVKLRDLYNTKFFYKTFCGDLNYLFTTVTRLKAGEDFQPNIGNDLLGRVYEAVRSGEEVEFDLAETRLTTDALRCIYTAEESGIKFCDSCSEWRDVIMKENLRRKSIDTSGMEPLPTFGYKTDIKEYIKALRSDIVYTTSDQPTHISLALICLTAILRPSVQINIDKVQNILPKYINSKIPVEEVLSSDEWYMCTEEGIQIVSGDSIYVQEAQKEVTPKEALHYATLIPTDFGKKVLLHNPSYQGLFRSCLLILQEFQEGSSKTLEEIFT